jgi:hypothetical protein
MGREILEKRKFRRGISKIKSGGKCGDPAGPEKGRRTIAGKRSPIVRDGANIRNGANIAPQHGAERAEKKKI